MQRALKPRQPYPQQGHPLNRGLLGAWLCAEGGGSRFHDSARGQVGFYVNGPSWRTSVRGVTPFFVPASSQYVGITFQTASRPYIQGPLTMAIWANSNSPAAAQIFFALPLDDTAGAANSVNFAYSGGVLLVQKWGGGTVVSSGISASSDVWYHVVYSVDGNNNNKIYVDGKLAATSTTATNTGQATICRLASFNAAFPSPYLSGMLDDCRIFNRVLTPAEIWALYNTDYSEFLPFRQILSFDTPAAPTTFVPIIDGGLLRRGITGGRLAA